MTIVAIYEHSAAGAAALEAAYTTATRESRDLLVLGTTSGSSTPGAGELETAAVTSDVETVLGGRGGWELRLVPPGEDAVGALTEHVHTLSPELVVIGTPHRSAVGKLLLGRARQRLLLEIDTPVLIVKPQRDRPL
ncbi:universal stress protein [Pseudonocardia alni]|uniref:universal stress protein n=1 Tax=Pseudonocardia alni TaxID=33907 RepID=UPI00280C0544|nr:universal stress protein [Pseudonocardia alni]